jgi:hypothetical protein
MVNNALRIAVIVTITCCLAGLAEAQTEEIVRTIPMDAGGQFELSNISGDIMVTGVDGTDLTIRATKRLGDRGTAGSDDEALSLVDVKITQRGSLVAVETTYERSGRNGPSVSVDYEVTVPRETAVSVESVSGGVTIEGIDGETRLEVVSGAVELTSVSRLVEAEAVSGAVRLTDVASDEELSVQTVAGSLSIDGGRAPRLEVSSVQGAISLSRVAARRVEVDTVAGAVSFEGALAADGRYEFKSHAGHIGLTVPAGTGFELEAESFSGNFDSDLPIMVVGGTQQATTFERGVRALEGAVGNGGAHLEITTFSGNITIESR